MHCWDPGGEDSNPQARPWLRQGQVSSQQGQASQPKSTVVPSSLKFTAPTIPFPSTPPTSQCSLQLSVHGKCELQVIDGETELNRGPVVGLEPEIPNYYSAPFPGSPPDSQFPTDLKEEIKGTIPSGFNFSRNHFLQDK